MDETRKVLASLQNIEDALVILVLDKLITAESFGGDRALERMATGSITARLVRLLGAEEG